MMTTSHELATGRLIDVHGDGDRGVVLLWHGRGSDSREAVAGLAGEIARFGLRVVVPDWSADSADGGRGDLLASVAYARERAVSDGHDPESVTVVGWSLGGTAALGLVLQGESLDLRVRRIVLLSPGDGPRAIDPFSGAPLPDPFPDGSSLCPVDVVSATHDDIATPALVRRLEVRLRAAGWRTSWSDVEADHWSIAMTRLDVEADRGVPADDPASRAAGRQVAAIVAAATS